MLDTLSPARRRFVLLAGALGALLALTLVATLLLRGGPEPVTPVSQDEPGPVLLVPGYGGGTTGLEVLAQALRDAGRDVTVVRESGDDTGDLRDQASALGTLVDRVLASTGASSVDLVGYSAGGVVVRLYVADGGGSLVRRVVTLGSPHHGTELAGLAGDLAPDVCPVACQQLATDSDLMRELAADDETPPGPLWVAVWTTDDKTVVPPDSGVLEGAVSFSVQSVCPGQQVSHGDLPMTPSVMQMTLEALRADAPELPTTEVCAGPVSR